MKSCKGVLKCYHYSTTRYDYLSHSLSSIRLSKLFGLDLNPTQVVWFGLVTQVTSILMTNHHKNFNTLVKQWHGMLPCITQRSSVTQYTSSSSHLDLLLVVQQKPSFVLFYEENAFIPILSLFSHLPSPYLEYFEKKKGRWDNLLRWQFREFPFHHQFPTPQVYQQLFKWSLQCSAAECNVEITDFLVHPIQKIHFPFNMHEYMYYMALFI